MSILKKIFFPTGKKKQVDGLRSWTVRWTSYRRRYLIADLQEEAEVFVNLKDAEAFKEQLEDAFKFTKSSVTNISITENKQ